MKPIKIQISAEVREFNEAVYWADFVTDYKFDQSPADTLLNNTERQYPATAQMLANAIAGISVKKQ